MNCEEGMRKRENDFMRSAYFTRNKNRRDTRLVNENSGNRFPFFLCILCIGYTSEKGRIQGEENRGLGISHIGLFFRHSQYFFNCRDSGFCFDKSVLKQGKHLLLSSGTSDIFCWRAL